MKFVSDSVVITEIYTLFLQTFRETNVFTKEITKELIWRNIHLVRVNSNAFLDKNSVKSIFLLKNDFTEKKFKRE